MGWLQVVNNDSILFSYTLQPDIFTVGRAVDNDLVLVTVASLNIMLRFP